MGREARIGVRVLSQTGLNLRAPATPVPYLDARRGTAVVRCFTKKKRPTFAGRRPPESRFPPDDARASAEASPERAGGREAREHAAVLDPLRASCLRGPQVATRALERVPLLRHPAAAPPPERQWVHRERLPGRRAVRPLGARPRENRTHRWQRNIQPSSTRFDDLASTSVERKDPATTPVGK